MSVAKVAVVATMRTQMTMRAVVARRRARRREPAEDRVVREAVPEEVPPPMAKPLAVRVWLGSENSLWPDLAEPPEDYADLQPWCRLLGRQF